MISILVPKFGTPRRAWKTFPVQREQPNTAKESPFKQINRHKISISLHNFTQYSLISQFISNRKIRTRGIKLLEENLFVAHPLVSLIADGVVTANARFGDLLEVKRHERVTTSAVELILELDPVQTQSVEERGEAFHAD